MTKTKNIKISQAPSLSYKKTMSKIDYYFELISETILWSEKYKVYDIITASDLNICIQNLESIFNGLTTLKNIIKKQKKISQQNVSKLQKINDELSLIFKSFGTKKIDSVLNVCYGASFLKSVKKKYRQR